MPPSRQRHRLSAVIYIHTRNIKTPEATEFPRVLDRHVRGPLIVVQDRLTVHRAAVRRWPPARPQDAPRVMVDWLPSHASEFNPTEQLWNQPSVDIAKLAPSGRDDLRGRVRRSLTRQRSRANLIVTTFDHARLLL